MATHFSPLTMFGLACALLAAIILLGYLVKRPPLNVATKLGLFVGLGVLPLSAALAGNVQGYEATKQRTFCGSCHVMVPHASDSNDLTSSSLASRHGRNKLFGDENCYMCHADYGMFGTITTKLGGMGHVWYYVTEYRNVTLEEAKKTIHLRKPFPNDSCMQCHSTKLDIWLKTPDHKSSLQDLRDGRIGCASGGCHGFAHPFTKPADQLQEAAAARAAAKATADAGAPPCTSADGGGR